MQNHTTCCSSKSVPDGKEQHYADGSLHIARPVPVCPTLSEYAKTDRTARADMDSTRRQLLRGATGVAVLALLSGCQMTAEPHPGATTATPLSGIEGITMVDAGCAMSKHASPCADKPVSAKVTVSRPHSNDTLAEVVSDSDGHYAIALPPGAYDVTAANPTGGPVPYAAPRAVTVQDGRYARVIIHLDSGVR